MDSYFKKLLDPRWQKKRLEILNRDNFTCQQCNSVEKTLHIHHLRYGKDPWDIDEDFLITLCEDCHDKETEIDKEIIWTISSLKRFFSSEKLLEYIKDFV